MMARHGSPPATFTPVPLSPVLIEDLYLQAHAARWRVARRTFATAIESSVSGRFPVMSTGDQIDAFARSLHVADLALACACRDGDGEAWEHFIATYRPTLHAAARAIVRGHDSHELVESLFADLYGLTDSGGVRASLFAYYHGRARLGSWLRSVLAQRHVDRYRTSRRLEPLDETQAPAAAEPAIDPHRQDYLRMAQQALDAAIGRLEPADRLRLRLYYAGAMTLAQIGRTVGEHEATVSRKLERARRALRRDVETHLSQQGLAADTIAACLDLAASAPELDASRLLAGDPE